MTCDRGETEVCNGDMACVRGKTGVTCVTEVRQVCDRCVTCVTEVRQVCDRGITGEVGV